MRVRLRALLVSVAVALCAQAAAAQDAYKVGITGAVTGPGSGTYAPVLDAVRLYIGRVNANGGVNGHPIEIQVQDNQAQPSRAAADVKRFTGQDDVVLVVNSSLSSTYAPVIADTKRAGTPLLFLGGVCPREVFPPADRLLFCSTAYGAEYDSRFAMSFIKDKSGGDAKLGLASMAIPISRGEVDYAAELAGKMGMKAVSNQVIPPPTADYAPFATKIKEAGADWGYSWAPWVTQVKTFEALRRLGWDGGYVAYGHINAEDELARLKDPSFYVFNNNAMFVEDLPVLREIEKAAEGKSQFPPTLLSEGWIGGMVLEAIMKKVPWPPTREKVIAAMNDLEVDTRGLRGGPIRWTKDNHFRTTTYYRVYRWDPDKNAIVREKDWTGLDVK